MHPASRISTTNFIEVGIGWGWLRHESGILCSEIVPWPKKWATINCQGPSGGAVGVLLCLDSCHNGVRDVGIHFQVRQQQNHQRNTSHGHYPTRTPAVATAKATNLMSRTRWAACPVGQYQRPKWVDEYPNSWTTVVDRARPLTHKHSNVF